jgi:hypothetical protein
MHALSRSLRPEELVQAELADFVRLCFGVPVVAIANACYVTIYSVFCGLTIPTSVDIG